MGHAPGIATADIVEGLKSIPREAGQRIDRRTRRTRASLTAALFELLQTKSLKDVSVKELTELADVNRATFYAHYGSVADIAAQINADLAATVQPLVSEHADEIRHGMFRPFVAALFHNIAENEEALTVLFGPNSDGAFLNELVETIHTEVFAEVADPDKRDATCVPVPDSQALCNYHFCFIAGGVSSIMQVWVNGGRKEPVEDMVDVVSAYIDSANACLTSLAGRYGQAGTA